MREASAELVRIDDKGEAHPIGTVASRRMRSRQGAFRVLPAPGHVVFMRYTGEDGRRDEEDGAIVRLSGEITAPAAVCDVLAMLVHTRWRGELVVLDGEAQRSIFMENGNIVGAETNVLEERIGEVLFRFGAITRDQHAEVLSTLEAQPGSRYGETAVALELLSEEAVYAYVGKQIEEVVFGMLGVDDGTFFFLDGFDATRLRSHHTLSTTMILMDGVTRLDEIRYFQSKIPSPDWVAEATGRGGEVSEEHAPILAAVDGKLSVTELGRVTGTGEFETTKALYALAQSNHVRILPPRMDGGPKAFVSAANVALRLVHQRADAAGKGTAFRQAVDNFATGAGVYDMLFLGAGPNEKGMLDPARVANNAVVACGDSDDFLLDKLHGYVSFAVFAVGALLGSEAEAELDREIQPILSQLQPTG
jgi:hypothetical protein